MSWTEIRPMDIREGDLIRAHKGEIAMEGRVRTDGDDEPLHLHSIFREYIVSLDGNGFDFLLLERPMPTEPGAYHDKDGDLWVLDREGNWIDFSTGKRIDRKPGSNPPTQYGPFVRLITVKGLS